MTRTLVALAVVLGAALAAVWHVTLGFRALTSEDARRIRVADAPVPVSPLRVLDPRGASVELWNEDPQTHVWLVSFVYTRCPSICQALGDEFQQLQASMQATEGVRLASLSFDRAHDSPAALAEYAEHHRADPARWLVAVPDSDIALSRLLHEAGVIAIDDGTGGYSHNAAIHVVTASGKLVALFDLERHAEALAYARGLASTDTNLAAQ
ncbi:MAG TPA: SCO family protein [Burkholderiales bacterium]|nr:SCO family protein [Burkholderiales bacterium]